jgi:hypothetical protein
MIVAVPQLKTVVFLHWCQIYVVNLKLYLPWLLFFFS